jgi:hypothetical protein
MTSPGLTVDELGFEKHSVTLPGGWFYREDQGGAERERMQHKRGKSGYSLPKLLK